MAGWICYLLYVSVNIPGRPILHPNTTTLKFQTFRCRRKSTKLLYGAFTSSTLHVAALSSVLDDSGVQLIFSALTNRSVYFLLTCSVPLCPPTHTGWPSIALVLDTLRNCTTPSSFAVISWGGTPLASLQPYWKFTPTSGKTSLLIGYEGYFQQADWLFRMHHEQGSWSGCRYVCVPFVCVFFYSVDSALMGSHLHPPLQDSLFPARKHCSSLTLLCFHVYMACWKLVVLQAGKASFN